jgi:SAM-dependent methyltransferase
MLVWEEVACNWCGEVETEFLFKGHDLLQGLPGKFRMVRCTKCGLLRQNPRLKWESLKDYYSDNYVGYNPIIQKETSSLQRLNRAYGMRKRLRVIEKYQPGGNILDIGCGTGIFLAEAKDREGWKVSGIEPNEKAYEYAQNNLNVPIINARFGDAKLDFNSFDVITMWNVLEHLAYPVDDIKTCYSLLKKGGLLVFTIPNLASFGLEIFNKYWNEWDLPRHLYLFPNHLVRIILEEIGFRLIDERCIAGSHAAVGLSLSFLFRGNAVNNRYGKVMLDVYHSMPARILMGIPFWLTARLKKGALITFIVRKT